jgi:hypothetical protein
MLTNCRLSVEEVREALRRFEAIDSPPVREFIGCVFGTSVEELCLDWLEMRAAQAESEVKGGE